MICNPHNPLGKQVDTRRNIGGLNNLWLRLEQLTLSQANVTLGKLL